MDKKTLKAQFEKPEDRIARQMEEHIIIANRAKAAGNDPRVLHDFSLEQQEHGKFGVKFTGELGEATDWFWTEADADEMAKMTNQTFSPHTTAERVNR
jgi:hypothetical protein